MNQVVSSLLGTPSPVISNVRYDGANVALGTFSGGTGIIGFEDGVIISTGKVASVVGPNRDSATTTVNHLPGDPSLDSLVPGLKTFDAAALEFDFECANAGNIAFEYVFGSEEYNLYVDSAYNDVFGFFVNGSNIALLPDGVTPISINTVNGGNPFGHGGKNANLYRNNDCWDGGCPINTELNGLTVVLTASASVRRGINHIKLVIADGTDSLLDSDVFLRARSLICGTIQNSPPACDITPPGPFAVSASRPLSFVVSGHDPDSGSTISLDVVNLPVGAAMKPALPLTGANTGIVSTFSWTPTQPGTYDIMFRITDDHGAADTCIAQVTVNPGTTLRLLDTDPRNETPDIPWATPLHIIFSQPVPPPELDTGIFVSSRRGNILRAAPSLRGTMLTYTPMPLWPDDDTITVRIYGTLTDFEGNPFDGNGNGKAEGSPIDDYVYVVTTAPGVLPGDANDDGIVDERDILPLGIYWGLTGPVRSRHLDRWEMEQATPWIPRRATYADCNGDGMVDSLDICAIAEFFDRSILAKRAATAGPAAELSSLDADIVVALARTLLNCANVNESARQALLQWLENRADNTSPAPRVFRLSQNYPNPFNAATVITYSVPCRAFVNLGVFDILGRPVRTLVQSVQPPGDHTISWDGTDNAGAPVASGVYVYRLSSPAFAQSRTMILLR